MIALPIHWQSALVSQTTKASRTTQESVEMAANDPKPTISSRRQMSAFLAKKIVGETTSRREI